MAHTPPAGTLAGSMVLLLSLAWGASVILGRCDISDTTGRAVDKTLTRGAGAPWYFHLAAGTESCRKLQQLEDIAYSSPQCLPPGLTRI